MSPALSKASPRPRNAASSVAQRPGAAEGCAAAKRECCAATVPLYQELIMKKGNVFVTGQLLGSTVGSEALLQKVQHRPVQPGDEVLMRQQYSSGTGPIAGQRAFIEILDLSV